MISRRLFSLRYSMVSKLRIARNRLEAFGRLYEALPDNCPNLRWWNTRAEIEMARFRNVLDWYNRNLRRIERVENRVRWWAWWIPCPKKHP